MCKPNVRVVISCSTSEPDGAGHGACGGGPEGTHLPVDRSGSGDGAGCLSGPHLPPPGHPPLGSYSLMGIPMYLEGAAGRHIYFMKCDILPKIFHKLSQLVVSKVSKFHLKMMQHSPALGSLFRRCMQFSLPI